MAILLIEKGKGEVVTAPVIRSEIGGGRVQISGRMTTVEANDVALLLRVGRRGPWKSSRSPPTVSPSLGAENIKKGFDSTVYGFRGAVAVHHRLLFAVRGVLRARACAPVVPDSAPVRLLQATLTLPGIAAIALTLRHGDRRHVLINERVRESCAGGATPRRRSMRATERAFGTILDSNVTTLIRGCAAHLSAPGR